MVTLTSGTPIKFTTPTLSVWIENHQQNWVIKHHSSSESHIQPVTDKVHHPLHYRSLLAHSLSEDNVQKFLVTFMSWSLYFTNNEWVSESCQKLFFHCRNSQQETVLQERWSRFSPHSTFQRSRNFAVRLQCWTFLQTVLHSWLETVCSSGWTIKYYTFCSMWRMISNSNLKAIGMAGKAEFQLYVKTDEETKSGP